MARHRLGRGLRVVLWIAAVVILLGVVIRLVLDPIATHYTRQALDNIPDYQGDFAGVHVSLLPPGYRIRKLKLSEELRDGPAREPFLYADHAQVALSGSELLHGRLVARVRIDEPKITVINRVAAKEEEKEEKKPPPKEPRPAKELRKMPELRVERIEIRDGQFAYKDPTSKNEPQIWVHHLELAVENLVTRRELAGGRPVTVNGSGKLGKSGDLTIFVSADPWAKRLTFAGRMAVKGFRLAELYDFIEAKTKMHVPEGTIDLFVEFEARNGEITGGVRPVLKNVKIQSTEDGMVDRLKAWAADKALDLASDRVPDRNAVATTIPIKGRVTDPKAQLVPTVMGVIRNAFVEGVTSGFTRLPPDEAPKKEGVMSQIKHAIQKKAGPPKAQPEKTAQPEESSK